MKAKDSPLFNIRGDEKMRVFRAVAIMALCASKALAITVPSDGSTVIVPITDPGYYYIYSWGVWQWGGSSTITIADPEWMQYAANEAYGFDGWREVWDTHPWFNYDNDCNDLMINNQFVHWAGLRDDGFYQEHAFSENHKYRVTMFLEEEVEFKIFDTDYHDNIGSVNVGVEAVPEVPTWLMFVLGGLAIIYWRTRKRQ